MRIADELGWRRTSINSLRCEQFSDDRLRAMTERGLACVPGNQKFGYRDSFYMPESLVTKVCAFINDTRRNLIREMGWRIPETSGPIFLSARDGNALSDKAISKIFGMGFAASGAPKRAGIKSFRNKFTNDQIGKETIARRDLGLDTSSASIAAAVSMDLGHRSVESIKAYVDANVTKLTSRKRAP
ncbi:hypothetical protein KZJ38_21575 [Paraburkholderia edwinii]|uniref:Phage integrase family protein n=1 Tax=Paraburkholderia edwinii TaxID=2861782 RepID=A0ABX8UIK2_9BURK|nr:hypothetical protein [Paraburkholderia edwinii]QYD68774.1 hypothetical protein KZJ38_21575 [Paraburkholderia edwinii]